jgi:tetratricopeptide (TPR) repeat protein
MKSNNERKQMTLARIQRMLMGALFSILITLLATGSVHGQGDELTQARVYADTKNYEKAITIYEKLYEQSPLDAEVYSEYLSALIANKQVKDAQRIVELQIKNKPQEPMLYIDLGKVLLSAGKEKKAYDQFENAIKLMNGDDMMTTKMANAFTAINQDKFAIKAYEHAVEILRNSYLYGTPLAKLYAKTGDIEKAVNALLNMGPMQMPGADDPKAVLLQLLGNEPKNLQLAQKALIKRINDQPENTWYAELLTWLYTQKDDWEGALIQIEALDARNKENGERLLEFAQEAQREQQYEVALKALGDITDKGKDQPIYAIAKAQKLNVMMQQLQETPSPAASSISALEQEYSAFFSDFPQYYNTETLRDYATVEAQYAGKPEKAIELLQTAIARPGARREFAGWAKLQLGDYYILVGKIWDASLIYSQVDKDFREDRLGEEARFRNAKLAYYRGDFEWAQGQLSVLKASTSELIANDALYLSVLITENIPPDSNMVPLERYAYADLLLFQNKDRDAEALLDSISTAYPKHPLNDDILMLRAQMAQKHHDYVKALDYLKQVYERYGDDVLADDALFKTAQLYEKYLKQPEKAREFYEKLIVDFPGSTYVQMARSKLSTVTENSTVVP